MKKKIIPIEMLYYASDLTLDLVERVVVQDEMQIIKSFLKNLTEYFDYIIQSAEAGKPVVGHHFAFPGDLLRCFDITPICFEGLPYIFSALFPSGSEPYYDSMNAFGHPYHTCTSQKGTLGMIIDGLFEFDAIVTPSAPCDNGVGSYQLFEYLGVPLVVADMPYLHNDRGYTYFANELRRVVEEVGGIIGQEPDYSKFKKAVEYSSRAHEFLIEINEMRKLKPCPVESMSNPLITAANAFMSGSPQFANFFKETYEIIKKRVKNHESRNGIENYRVMFPYMSIFYDIGFYEWLDREIGVSLIVDIFNYFWFNPIQDNLDLDTIFLELAKTRMEAPMVRQSESFVEVMIDDYVKMAKEFDVDCAILTEHIGCKQLAAASQIIREELRENLGIPMLSIDLDVGDKRFTSIEVVKHEITEFTKTLL